ncbi:MAG: WD40 repeat domain-containing protein [Candidatus Caldatribacteriaceae bacterium]
MFRKSAACLLVAFFFLAGGVGFARAENLLARTEVGCVKALAFSPDGALLVAVTLGVEVRRAPTLEKVGFLRAQTGFVTCMALAPDGSLLALGSEKKVELWDMASGSLIRILEGHTNWVRSLTFSPDGQFLASTADDKTVRLWEVASWNCVATLQGHRNWVMSVAFSPDGRFCASGSIDKTVILWDWRKGGPVFTLYHDAGVSTVVFPRVGIFWLQGWTMTQYGSGTFKPERSFGPSKAVARA